MVAEFQLMTAKEYAALPEGSLIETRVIDGLVTVGVYAGTQLPIQRIFAEFVANSWR